MRVVLVALALALALLAPAAPGAAGTPEPSRATAGAATSAPGHPRALPALRVHQQVKGLSIAWDVQPIGHRRLLITERDTAHLILWNGSKHRVRFPSNRIWVSGETGLMSMAIDPRFGRNHRFYTCSGWVKKGGGHDVRVNAWRLTHHGKRARYVETLVAGFPTTSGRHGGCRLLITSNGSMLVGTGDAADEDNPRNLKSLGGKTLRLDRMTGRPWPTNPFIDAKNHRKRYVQTYGHRNVQGLSERRDGSLWSIEQGTYRDDEVNRLRNGGDYGWQPGPGYDESPPMTDFSLPGRQIGARWSSGDPTLATSGGSWVYGKQWGRYNGTLAVAALKASRIVFMKFDSSGKLKWTKAPARLRDFGRLRSVTQAANGDLLVTTDNGDDAVLRVSPR
ncbi:PQQ-dependent sugar dehydrogenase [Nocardioides taihuensis]|uniref:PQQ-dependent sugar dehydrogenase n=1 Tax=Nocardioides taihuensis TaxID=1835606 RepID=A0ABW0BJT7_9ACTN